MNEIHRRTSGPWRRSVNGWAVRSDRGVSVAAMSGPVAQRDGNSMLIAAVAARKFSA